MENRNLYETGEIIENAPSQSLGYECATTTKTKKFSRKKIVLISIAIFTVVAVVASAIIIPKILNKQIPEENPFKNVVKISAGGSIAGLRKDGTVVVLDNEEMQSYVENWTDITAISVGSYHIVGLRKDGTVVSTPALTEQDCWRCGQDAVSDWTDIVAISANGSHTVGLKRDGTVVAAGDNSDGQCNVQEWTEIVAISAGVFHTVGLKKDGTVVATEFTDENTVYSGWSDTEEWTDIVAISAGHTSTAGLKKDGTVVAVGDNDYGHCDEVSEWTDIVAISATDSYGFVGIKSNGTVVGHEGENWTDIVEISATDFTIVGLKKDGTVLVYEWDEMGESKEYCYS